MQHSSVRHPVLCALLAEAEAILSDAFDAAAKTLGDVGAVEQVAEACITRLRPQVVTAALAACVESAPRAYRCSQCGGWLDGWQNKVRRVVTAAGVGEMQSKRYRCRTCGTNHYPLEEANGLRGTSYTLGARHRIAALAALVPYGHVPDSAGWFGIEVSGSEVDRITHEVSSWRREEEAAALSAVMSGTPNDGPALFEAPLPEDAPVLVSVDGAKVRSPERDENGALWYEARVGLIAAVGEDGRTSGPTRYVACVEDADGTFDLLHSAYRSTVPTGRRCVFVADGATWIWDRVRLYFPEAVQILDIYHAGEHVGSAAMACYGEHDPRTKRRKIEARDLLMRNNGIRCLLREMLVLMRHPSEIADVEAARTEFRYLWRNRHRMNYEQYRRVGLPVGSGAMESAIKQVCIQRMRQPGMKWTRKAAAAILRLRAAVLSRQLDATVRRKSRQLQDAARPYHMTFAASTA